MDEISKRLDNVIAEVEQLKASNGRSPASALPQTEAEFLRQHEAAVLSVVKEELRQRDWEQAAKKANQMAYGMAGKFSLPDSMRSDLQEFGDEFVRRARALFEEFRNTPGDDLYAETPAQARWVAGWTGLRDWSQSEIKRICPDHADEMWMWFAEAVYDLENHSISK
jgi:hypothetical protein